MTLAPADRDKILRGLVSLPPHADVRDGLQRLRSAGFRLVTLTNSAPAAVEQQLKNAEIGEYFELSFSVDTVRKFKPAPEVYRLVATELQVRRHNCGSSLRTRGTCSAPCVPVVRGLRCTPGKALFPLADKPDIVGPDLRNVADQIVKRDMPKSRHPSQF